MAKFDLYFQGKKPENVTGTKFFTSGFNRSIAVRGPQKLVNQWIKRFMTSRGSDPTDTEAGTEFPGLFGSNITSMQDIRDVVLLAIDACDAQIHAIQRVTQPDEDELLLRSSLTAFQVTSEDGFEAWITIGNVAGAEVTLRLPDYSTRT